MGVYVAKIKPQTHSHKPPSVCTILPMGVYVATTYKKLVYDLLTLHTPVLMCFDALRSGKVPCLGYFSFGFRGGAKRVNTFSAVVETTSP